MTSFYPQVHVHQTQTAVYLHINSGVHYAITTKANGVYQLDPICGASKYATEEQLRDTAIWRKC